MADKLRNSTPGTPNEVTGTLLADSDGLFIGEYHTSSMAADFLTTHMQERVADGVTTIYMEMDHQQFTSNYVSEECYSNYFGEIDEKFKAEGVRSNNQERDRENGYPDVIRVAREHGLRVIGIENDYSTGEAMSAYFDIAEDGTWVRTELGNYAKNLENRDQFAAEVVNATRDGGKFIMYGGANHSREANSLDYDASPGINVLLDIPAIDFMSQDDRREREQEALVNEHGILKAAYLDFGNAIRELVKNESVIEKMTDGSANYVVTNRGGYRYPERNKEVTDNRDALPTQDRLPTDIGQALVEAGVCDAPSHTFFRGVEGLEQLVDMVDAQYNPAEPDQNTDYVAERGSLPLLSGIPTHIER